jgi:hypothetical protein
MKSTRFPGGESVKAIINWAIIIIIIVVVVVVVCCICVFVLALKLALLPLSIYVNKYLLN